LKSSVIYYYTCSGEKEKRLMSFSYVRCASVLFDDIRFLDSFLVIRVHNRTQ